MNVKKALVNFGKTVAATVGISAGVLFALNLEEMAHKRIDKDFEGHPKEMAAAHKLQNIIGYDY